MRRTITLMVFVAFLLLPTGTPDDFISIYIMNKLGFAAYSILIMFVLLGMWYYRINLIKIKKVIKTVIN